MTRLSPVRAPNEKGLRQHGRINEDRRTRKADEEDEEVNNGKEEDDEEQEDEKDAHRLKLKTYLLHVHMPDREISTRYRVQQRDPHKTG